MKQLPILRKALILLLAFSAGVALAKEATPKTKYGGTIVNEQGQPIGGVKLQIWWRAPTGPLTRGSCTTDAQGHWQVELPSDVRDVDVQLAHPDYIGDQSYREDKPPLSRLRDGTSVMVMKKGLTVNGRVQNEAGQPLANALILSHDRYATTAAGAALEDSTTARTNADGRFVLTGLAAGPRELTVTAPGYGPERVPIEVTPEMTTVQVTMRPGGVFRGQVLDEEGKPVEDAGIYCRRWKTQQGHIVSLTGRTDAEGRFTVADAPLKGELEFYVSKKGFLIHNSSISLPVESYHATLYRPPVLSGTVLDDQTGQPVADFELTQGILWPTSSRLSWLDRQAVHAEDGAFAATFERFGVGSALPWCAVRIRAAGYVPETTSLVLVGEKAASFTVRLQQGQPWGGSVHDPADRPVPNASVAWIGPDHIAFIKDGRLQLQYTASPEWVVPTDSSGRFELPPARTDGILLALHDKGYGWWRSRDFARDSVVRLTAWSKIAGTVRRAGLDNHTAQLKLQLADPAADVNDLRIRWLFEATSHVDGQFTFEFVPSLRLAVGHVSEQKFFLADHVTPKPGQTCDLTIQAEPPRPAAIHSLVGRVLPALKDIGIESAAAPLQNQRVLLCFFDLQQRPSRKCLQQLAARAQQLHTQGIAVVTVPAVQVNQAELDRWIKDNPVPFPVGTIPGDESKTRSAWGVQSLPWLILTDKDHIVCAEGFGFDELQNRIEAATKEQRTTVCLVKGPQGAALAGKPVIVHPMGTKCQTDAGGRFSIQYAPPADARGLYVHVRHKDPDLIGVAWLPPAGGDLDVMLAPAVSVQGHVVDPNGKPIAGAQVAALPMSNQYVLTDAAGAFDIAWSREWEPPNGLCLMARHAQSNLAALVDMERQTRTVTVRLEPALMLAGVVEDEDDKPVRGVSVGISLRNHWTCGTPVEPVTTDAAGRYVFRALPHNQEYLVWAKAGGYWAQGGTTGVINNRPKVAEAGRIVLRRPILTLSGIVVDANDRPVTGIKVGSGGAGQPERTAETDAQGRFTLPGLCQGDVEIWARLDRILYGTVRAEAGRKEVKVVVRPIL